MSIKKVLSSLALTAVCLMPSLVEAGPMGLNPVGPVQSAASDAQSINFQNNLLPTVLRYIDARTTVDNKFRPNSGERIDADNLRFRGDQDLRVYFVEEDAGHHNTLGTTRGNDFTLAPGDNALIFPDSSQPPLYPGDFVDLGTLPSGEKVNFFLGENTAFVPNTPAGQNIWWSDKTQNRDWYTHVLAVEIPSTNLILLAWEDLSRWNQGFDKDFNDLFVVLEKSVVTPEPETYLILASCLGVVALVRRKQEATQPNTIS